MTLTADETTNSTASAFDVELTFYAGPTYADLTLSDYVAGAMPTLTGWVDVSALVIFGGSLSYGRSDSSLTWSANLRGTGYQKAWFGPGRAILCLRRLTVGGVETEAQGLWFVGQILSGTHEDDYRHGGSWARTVSGLDTFLQRSTAPRLTAGRIDLLATASVEASSTLATPAIEAGSGEFAGTLVSVGPENTIDGNLNTVWISAEAPGTIVHLEATGWFDKVFFKPITGYDQTKLWWIELHLRESFGPGDYYLENAAGEYLFLTYENEEVDGLGVDDRLIICASKADFEAYTGGAAAADLVIEAKSWPWRGKLVAGKPFSPGSLDGTAFALDPATGWVKLRRSSEFNTTGTVREAIAWDQDGSAPVGMGDQSGWVGNSIPANAEDMPPGYGLQRKKPGTDGDTGPGTPGGFEVTHNLTPGASYTAAHQEWLLYTLESQSAVLTADVAAGAGTIQLSSTTGLLDSGTAICETDTFTYAGRTSTTLTGVSGIGVHVTGASVYQYLDSVAQTGMPVTTLQLLRRNASLPRISAGKVYCKATGFGDVAPRTPEDGETDWQTDYDGSVLSIPYDSSGTAVGAEQTLLLAGADGGSRWVQYLLIVIDSMSDGGRAKLNEARLMLAQTQVDYSGSGDIDTISSAGLAFYMLGLIVPSVTLVSNLGVQGHRIGDHATAIAPYPQVLNDLARVTGCVCDWGLAGTVTWRHDMWWPDYLESTQLSATARLTPAYLRGQVQYSGQRPNEVGVRVHARTPDSLHHYTAEFPPHGLTATQQIAEITDLVISDSAALTNLAQTQYYKAGLHYVAGSQQATLTLRGIGEWLRPEQWLTVICDNDTGETLDDATAEDYDTVGWLVESVTWEWGMSNNFRTWKATAQCRRYWR